MKNLLALLWVASSTMATGAFLVAMGAEVTLAMTAQNAVGPGTQVSGLTVGIMAAGVVAGFGFAWTGGKQLVSLGGYIRDLRQSLEDAQRTTQLMSEFGTRLEVGDERFARIISQYENLERRVATNERLIEGLRNRLGKRREA